MVKIKDIAERCGLSVASVSKALHGKTDINPKTVEYVKKVAKEMGYIPNSSARMLKTNHSYIIGLLFIDSTNSGLTHEYFSIIISSIRDECKKYGYDITFISNQLGKSECSYYEHAKYRNCDGVIIASADFKDPRVIEIVESEIPTITIDYDFNDHSSVNSDNIQGMKDIIKYLYEMGHRDIAFIHGELTSVTQKRIKGFYNACSEYDINVNEEFVREGRYHIPKVSGQITRELIQKKHRPTCIIYPDDYSLLGGITEIEKQGLKIPEDISVVGYDGILLSRLMRPIFTTYVQDAVEIGKKSTQKLVEIIDNPKVSLPERISILGKLQEGQTVKKLN